MVTVDTMETVDLTELINEVETFLGNSKIESTQDCPTGIVETQRVERIDPQNWM